MGHLTASGDLTGLSRCPHCSVANPQLKSLWQTTSPLALPNNATVGFVWATYQCTSCSLVVLVQCQASLKSQNGWRNEYKVHNVFPDQRLVDEALPPIARTYLAQAFETLHAPDAAAVMAASAVDAMLKEKGYREGSLYARIDKAVGDHVLTDGMGQWAHAVRLEANNVRHADDASPHVTKIQAQRVVEFATALGDFLFVLTAKIEQGLRGSSPPAKITKTAPRA
jgi:hypothetical protein